MLGYVRVSTDEQRGSGAGLAAQRQAILAECERRGWTLVEVIEDAGYSAKDLKSPGIQFALDALKHGGADALMVAKLDRLSRSMLDFAGIMATAQKQSWGLVALDCAVDTTTPAGAAMAHILQRSPSSSVGSSHKEPRMRWRSRRLKESALAVRGRCRRGWSSGSTWNVSRDARSTRLQPDSTTTRFQLAKVEHAGTRRPLRRC